jgi:hypothetical protein
MDIESLQHPLVRAAITAMNSKDRATWLMLFAQDAVLTDDGKRRDFVSWSDSELFGENDGQLTTVDRQEDEGLTIVGKFHSSRWGDFNTMMRFQVQNGTITRLDIGQVDSE